MKAKLLVIDNYDSFTFNLVQMFQRYNLSISVFRADKITVAALQAQKPDYILISPGPKDPSAAGVSVEVVKKMHRTVPILGVCLGMQSINDAFGGQTVRAPLPMHGKTSRIQHKGLGLFTDLPMPLLVARYHSLAVNNVSDELTITAVDDSGVVMGLSHKKYPLHGVQFHPESFLTEHGFAIIENFLKSGVLKGELA